MFEDDFSLREFLRSRKESARESEEGLFPSLPPSPPALKVEKKWWSEGELVRVWVLSFVVLRRRRSAMAGGEEGMGKGFYLRLGFLFTVHSSRSGLDSLKKRKKC